MSFARELAVAAVVPIDMYRESPAEVERRHELLRERLAQLRPRVVALRALEAESRSIERLIASESATCERRLSLPLLDNLYVASPCSQAWNEMRGDERARFCGGCHKNVYNLSAYSRAQADALVLHREGKVCVRFYRRADGTVLTADCPTGKRRVRLVRAFVASALASLMAAIGMRAAEPPKTFVYSERAHSARAHSRPADSARAYSAKTANSYVTMGMGRCDTSNCRHVPPAASQFTGFEILESVPFHAEPSAPPRRIALTSTQNTDPDHRAYSGRL